jgi:hypothetical protein
VIVQLAWRNLVDRPWRALLLLAGYGVGVSVMITLLAVGEAMVAQASEERLVGGGEVTVLPDGIDLEVLKTGGLGGLFFSVPNARFLYHQLLAAPRQADLVRAVAPQMDDEVLYLTTADGRTVPVRASGELPDATRAVGAAPDLLAGTWTNDAGDDRWATPTVAEFRHDLDRFHTPPAGLAAPDSWGEWHYFNVLDPSGERWAFVSFILGGDVRGEEWTGQVSVTLHGRGRPERRFSTRVPAEAVRFDTTHADLVIGDARVTVDSAGAYRLVAAPREDGSGEPLSLRLRVEPAAGAYFPGAMLAEGAVASGYTVPGLRARATGSICVGADARDCWTVTDAPAYHDHNWGTWQGVTWEWGALRAGENALLFGRVEPPDSLAGQAPLFAYLTDSLGFVAVFRPSAIAWEDGRTVRSGGEAVRVPSRGLMRDVRGADTLEVELLVDDAAVTDTRLGLVERGEASLARALPRPWFVQMQGRVRLRARVRGREIAGEGTGFFETYR